MSRQVAVVAHTHWDREWYLPFETYRGRLVELLDDLIPELEAADQSAAFLLDGQLAVVDDYLEIRPEMESAIAALVDSGRLTIGPWYVLPDEFLVSGETLVRNLELGRKRGAELGGAMDVGYLPDMFGHISQMPQILRSFGFEQAVVWRGVPSQVDRSAFWWCSPDGSKVRAEYLPQGYGNGARLPADAALAADLVGNFEATNAELLLRDILWMHGSDHQPPTPGLAQRLRELNTAQDDYHFELESLPQYLETAPTTGLPTWTGELRSGARANLLMGVVSNRVDIRRAAGAAERLLERIVEPLAALLDPPERWPGAQLDRAWRSLILNSAHDSVCGCSLDEVCDAVLGRYAKAHQIASSLLALQLERFADSLASVGPTVVNPASHTRRGLVELLIPAGEPVPIANQVLEQIPGERVVTGLTCRALPETVQRELDIFRNTTAVDVETGSETVAVTVTATATSGSLAPAAVLAVLRELAEAEPGRPAKVTTRTRDSRVVLAQTPPVAGFGWSLLASTEPSFNPVELTDLTLDNGLVRATVDSNDGSITLGDHHGLGRLVDSGDCGDTYNYCAPVPDDLFAEVTVRDVRLPEAGPLRGRIQLTLEIADLQIEATVELRADEAFLRTRYLFDNIRTDHRLRVVHSLPHPATNSEAGCAFATVSRGLLAEGGPTEAALATFPARDFVSAGGLTIAAPGCFEYELTDLNKDAHATALAVTLVRSTGWLSRGPMPSRPLPAGPEIALRGSQVQGEVCVEHALGTTVADPFRMVADAFDPMYVVQGAGVGSRAEHGSALSADGGVISSVRRVGTQLQVRLFNPSDDAVTANVGSVAVELGPWKIETLDLVTAELR